MTDLISRADALEQMAQAECGLHYDDCEADNCSCSYIQRILDIPSADRPSGDWIEREDWNGDYYYDCSVCGESFVLYDGTPSMNLYHFCPNCGARMKGGAE